MIKNDHQAILDAFAQTLGAELAFDQDGICELELDGTPVSIRSSEADGTVVLSSLIADELPSPLNYSLLLDLLEIALTPGTGNGGNAPVIGCDRDTGAVILYLVCTASVLHDMPLAEILGEFMEMCSHAKSLLDEATTAPAMEQVIENSIAV